MKRRSGKHGRYCFKGALMKEVRSRTSNNCVSLKKKKAQIESLVIYRKNNSKTHNSPSIEEILSLCFLDPRLLENTIFWLGTKSNIISFILL